MKLLLDENLSRRLIPFLVHDYPGTCQVSLLGMEQASDMDLWRYAKQENFIVVTRDADFQEIALVHGHPPSVRHLSQNRKSQQGSHIETIARLPRTYRSSITV